MGKSNLKFPLAAAAALLRRHRKTLARKCHLGDFLHILFPLRSGAAGQFAPISVRKKPNSEFRPDSHQLVRGSYCANRERYQETYFAGVFLSKECRARACERFSIIREEVEERKEEGNLKEFGTVSSFLQWMSSNGPRLDTPCTARARAEFLGGFHRREAAAAGENETAHHPICQLFCLVRRQSRNCGLPLCGREKSEQQPPHLLLLCTP